MEENPVDLNQNDELVYCFVFQENPNEATHCLDLNLNDIRPGVASDGNSRSYLISRS